jgi:hypothetical protein
MTMDPPRRHCPSREQTCAAMRTALRRWSTGGLFLYPQVPNPAKDQGQGESGSLGKLGVDRAHVRDNRRADGRAWSGKAEAGR